MALATAFADKYELDPFFRTEVTIIFFQVAKLILLIAVVVVSATIFYADASGLITKSYMSLLKDSAQAALLSDQTLTELALMRNRALTIASAMLMLVILVFSYIITRLALAPVRQALESQKQFIGNVAHELRTPLAVIKTNTEVALMNKETRGDLRSTLTSTIEELDRTSEILNNLLSLSSSIRPEKLEFKDVDFGNVVHHVLIQLRKLSVPKRLEIEARMSDRRVAYGNIIALEQIVMNVIKNAITYTPRGGRILITVEPVHPNYMEFTVQDSGVGIARKDLFHIFEPYYRGDPSRTRSESGSGLGLTIVSELVKLHNGRITVRSAEKRGTTVTVLIPAGRQGPGFDDIMKMQNENASEVEVDFSHGMRRV